MADDFTPEQPGAFRIEPSKDPNRFWLMYRCPCGCGDPGQLSLITPIDAPHDKHTWGWDGSTKKPTLSPSVRRNVACKFHGHLEKGVWTACDDGPPVSPNLYKPGQKIGGPIRSNVEQALKEVSGSPVKIEEPVQVDESTLVKPRGKTIKKVQQKAEKAVEAPAVETKTLCECIAGYCMGPDAANKVGRWCRDENHPVILWERRFKHRLRELGFEPQKIDDYCKESGPPDSDALASSPEDCADQQAGHWRNEETEAE